MTYRWPNGATIAAHLKRTNQAHLKVYKHNLLYDLFFSILDENGSDGVVEEIFRNAI